MLLAFLPDQEVLDVALKVNNVTPGTRALQDAQVTSEDEITLYTEASKLKANDILEFKLLNLDSKVTITNTDDVKATISKGTATVKVTAKLGNYTFTLTDGEKSKVVTVKVIDATMPTSYSFENWREDDIGSIKEEDIKSNTSNVKSATTFRTLENGDITFSGNVNTMTGSVETGRFYRVRIKLNDKTDINSIKAVSKKGREYTITPVSNAEHTIFVDLDAEEKTTDLVIANKNASAKQIEKETASCHTVKFESTSMIWLRDAYKSENSSNGNYNCVTTCEEVNNNTHRIDVGVNLSALKEVNIAGDTNASNKDKWIPVGVVLGDTTINPGSSIKNAVYVSGNDNVKTSSKEDNWNDTDVILWVRSNGTNTQEETFTLTYNKGGNVNSESLTVTIVLHDATDPVVDKVSTSTTGIINTKVDAIGTGITLDSYKYGMSVVAAPEGEGTTQGRWYSLTLKTNVPVSSLVYKDGTKWAEIPERMKAGDYELVLWRNADANYTNGDLIELANRYASGVIVGNTGSGKKVTLTENKMSKTALANEVQAGAAAVYNDHIRTEKSLNELGLTGVSVVEKVPAKPRTNGTDNKEGTLKYNLYASSIVGGTSISLPIETKNDVTTVTLNVNSSNVSTITVNDESGKWILVHMGVRGNTDTLKGDTDTKAVIIDPTDANKVTNALSGRSGAMLVPVWINLSSDAVKAATTHTENGTVTPLEVKFRSTSPVEEHNSFFLKIVDENPMTEEVEAKVPEAMNSNEYAEWQPDGDNKELIKDIYEEFGWGSSETDTNGKAEAILNNMKVMEQAEITSSELVDNTVYVTVKANLNALKAGKDAESDSVRIPLTFDVSALGTKQGDDLVYASLNSDGSSCSCTTGKQSRNTEEIMKMNFKVSTINTGKATIDFIIFAGTDSEANCTTISDLYDKIATKKYIRYVVTFEQN